MSSTSASIACIGAYILTLAGANGVPCQVPSLLCVYSYLLRPHSLMASYSVLETAHTLLNADS